MTFSFSIALYFIKLRFSQASRYINELGFLRILFVMALFFFVSWRYFLLIPDKSFLIFLGTFIAFSIQYARNDKSFLVKNGFNFYLIFLIEYVILCLPFIILSFYFSWFTYSFIQLIILALIPLLDKPKTFNELPILFNPFQTKTFELKIGFRTTWPILILLMVISSFLSKNIPAYVGISFIMMLLYFSFFIIAEPKEMIQNFSKNSSQFIFKKTLFNLLPLLFIFIPGTICFLIYEPKAITMVALVYLLLIFCSSFVVLLKYAFYEQQKNLEIILFYIIGTMVAVFIPYLIPLPLLLWLFYFKKAKQNLNRFI